MNCPQCGAVNEVGSAFCGSCGTKLAPATTPLASNAPSGYESAGGYGNVGYPSASAQPAQQQVGYPPAQDPQYQPGYQQPSYQQPGQPAQGQYPQTGYPQGGQPAQGQYQPPPAASQYSRPAVPAASFDINRLTGTDKIVAVASLIALISIWLPWYSISFYGTYTLSGTSGHGWLWLEFVVALLLIVYLVARAAWERLPVALPVAHAPLLIIGTGLQFLFIILAFALVPYGNEGVGWAWGAFVGLIAAIVAGGPVIYPAVKSYLDSRSAGGGSRQY